MEDAAIPVKDRAIPLVAAGNADCLARRLKGTADEVWVKFLKIKFKHRAMEPNAWMAEIAKAKTIKSEAYK